MKARKKGRTKNYITTVRNDSKGWVEIDALQDTIGLHVLRLRGRYHDRKKLFDAVKVERRYTDDIDHGTLRQVREHPDFEDLIIDIYFRSPNIRVSY